MCKFFRHDARTAGCDNDRLFVPPATEDREAGIAPTGRLCEPNWLVHVALLYYKAYNQSSRAPRRPEPGVFSIHRTGSYKKQSRSSPQHTPQIPHESSCSKTRALDFLGRFNVRQTCVTRRKTVPDLLCSTPHFLASSIGYYLLRRALEDE
jgi:hypothetical protein